MLREQAVRCLTLAAAAAAAGRSSAWFLGEDPAYHTADAALLLRLAAPGDLSNMQLAATSRFLLGLCVDQLADDVAADTGAGWSFVVA